MTKYNWRQFGDESLPKIAIIAPANGGDWIKKYIDSTHAQIKALQDLGFCVCVPQYGDDENAPLIFEPGVPKGKAEIGDSFSRGVSPKIGAKQIIECAENGWDIFPFMGGWGFVDKIGEVIEHFNLHPEKKPKKPIRMFGYSDLTFAAFMQSHHPDVFLYYSTNIPSLLTKNEADMSAEELPTVRRNIAELRKLLTTGKPESYPRPILSKPELLIDHESIQYFPLHNDMIWCDSVDFDIKKGGDFCFGQMTVKAPQLKTSQPYILGLEGFLQKPTDNKKYDTQFPKYLEEFLRQRKEKGELPVAVETGLFTTRIDGGNGYVSKLHNEETGLIEINDLNVGKILKKMADDKAANMANDKVIDKRPNLVKQINEIIDAKEDEAKKFGNMITTIPDSIKEKVKAGEELTKEDIVKILESENEKILKIRAQIIEICDRYNVPTILNTRCGHTLNIGVVGGGFVDLKVKDKEVVLEQLPIKELPDHSPKKPRVEEDENKVERVV